MNKPMNLKQEKIIPTHNYLVRSRSEKPKAKFFNKKAISSVFADVI